MNRTVTHKGLPATADEPREEQVCQAEYEIKGIARKNEDAKTSTVVKKKIIFLNFTRNGIMMMPN